MFFLYKEIVYKNMFVQKLFVQKGFCLKISRIDQNNILAKKYNAMNYNKIAKYKI